MEKLSADNMSSFLQGVASKVQKCARNPSMVIFPCSMKTIPFTVPPSPHSPQATAAAAAAAAAAASSSSSASAGPTGAATAGAAGATPGAGPGVGMGPGAARKGPDHRCSWSSEPPETGSTANGSLPSSPGGRGSSDSIVSATTASAATEFRGAHSLGSLDPSLYKMADEDDDYDMPDNHIGRLWFAVEYERESEKLLVTLIKAKNLPSRVMGTSNSCDPFVRIYLLPDERRYLQSKFKKKTLQPKFEESFVFQVSNKALEERVLRLTVYDVDRHRKHSVIGHALYPLREHNYESDERVVIWRDLERELAETTLERGEMHISLSHNNHLERLTVGVFEGRDFKQDGLATADFYIKVSLLQQGKIVKTKKTDMAKKTTNPTFNESFNFKLPTSSVDVASVTITVMQHLSGQRDKPVGRIILGSFMFARGKELEHWNEMVAGPREQVSKWHVLT